jgi:hypothetical protein
MTLSVMLAAPTERSGEAGAVYVAEGGAVGHGRQCEGSRWGGTETAHCVPLLPKLLRPLDTLSEPAICIKPHSIGWTGGGLRHMHRPQSNKVNTETVGRVTYNNVVGWMFRFWLQRATYTNNWCSLINLVTFARTLSRQAGGGRGW